MFEPPYLRTFLQGAMASVQHFALRGWSLRNSPRPWAGFGGIMTPRELHKPSKCRPRRNPNFPSASPCRNANVSIGATHYQLGMNIIRAHALQARLP